MASRKEAGTDRQAVEYGDQRVERGHGGETHQVASGDSPRLTTQQGIVVSDDQNTLRVGERGPGALEDLWVPITSSPSCDQVIFIDHATDVSLFSDAVQVEVDRLG
jgi:hypothetical protein